MEQTQGLCNEGIFAHAFHLHLWQHGAQSDFLAQEHGMSGPGKEPAVQQASTILINITLIDHLHLHAAHDKG